MSQFWERTRAQASSPLGVGFRAALASVARRLGPEAEARPTPPAALAELARPHWSMTDYARLGLTLQALELAPSVEHSALVLRWFEGGEIGEQVSLLRTLSVLPEPSRFVQTGLQACRTNAVAVFEAIVCENPYPAAHFPEEGFNQAVMKAIFLDVSVRRVEGLAPRITPELVRMAGDYQSERRAAGRPVPDDVCYLLAHGT